MGVLDALEKLDVLEKLEILDELEKLDGLVEKLDGLEGILRVGGGVVVEAVAVEVMLGLAGDDIAQQEQGNEVRDRHEGIHAVGGVPHDVEADDAAHKDHGNEQDAVSQHPALTLEVLDGALAIVAPAEDGGEGKRQQAEGQQGSAHVGDLGEGGLGEGGTVAGADVGVGEDGADNHQSREGADDDRVPEGARRGDEGLAHGVARLGGSSDDGRGTQTGLVAEQTAGDTHAGCNDDRGAYKAAAGSLRRECRFTDELDSGPYVLPVGKEDVDAADDVEEGHERHQCATDAGDALDAAQQDERRQQADAGTCHPGGDAVGLVGDGRDSIGLHRVADAEGCQCREQGEQDGEPFPTQTTLQGVHGTAQHAAVIGLDAVLDGQQALAVLGGDAEHAREPAPQHSSGTTQGDGCRHTDDVTRADGCRQRGCQRTEL